MRKVVRKSPSKKELREPVEKLDRLELSANQRRFLQVLENGTPSVVRFSPFARTARSLCGV